MLKMEGLNVYAMSSLEACYDRQIPDSCGLVEESIGDNRKVINLLTKVLPIFKQYVVTANGVSKENYGGKSELLGGKGQSNIFSGVACRDVSCVIFKQVEINKLEIIITLKHVRKTEQIVVIVHVDDADFCSSG